jgi:hypothetical protein
MHSTGLRVRPEENTHKQITPFRTYKIAHTCTISCSKALVQAYTPIYVRKGGLLSSNARNLLLRELPLQIGRDLDRPHLRVLIYAATAQWCHNHDSWVMGGMRYLPVMIHGMRHLPVMIHGMRHLPVMIHGMRHLPVMIHLNQHNDKVTLVM